MTKTFKEGQKVRAIRETTALFEKFPEGTVFVVGQDVYRNTDESKEFTGGPAAQPNKYILTTKDFELALDPAKVKVGDTVTLTRPRSSITAEVTAVDPVATGAEERTLRLYGIPEWVLIGKDAYELTEHIPAPLPPQAGTLALATLYSQTGAYIGTRKVFRTRFVWVDEYNISYSDSQVKNLQPLVVVNETALDVHELATHNGLRDDSVRRLLADLGIKHPLKAGN